MYQPITDAVTRDCRRLRLLTPDVRLRIATGKRERKWRDKKERQYKPTGKPKSARFH